MSAVRWPLLLATLALVAPLSCTEPPTERAPEGTAHAALQQRPLNVRLTAQRGRAGEVLVHGGWGSASGTFGRRTEASHPGPMSLAADGQGRLYLLDQINRRVCVFERDGRLSQMIALESETVEDLALSAESLWTLTYLPGPQPAYRVDRRDRSGGLHQLRVHLDPSIQLVTGIFASGAPGHEEVWVEVRHDAQVQVVRDGSALPPGEQRSWRRGRASRGGATGRLLAARTGAAAAEVQRVTTVEPPRTTLRVETSAPLIAITALSSDARGRIYLGLALDEPRRRVMLVHDPASGASEQLELAGASSVTDSFRAVAVGPDGAVYQLQTAASGVTVLRWGPRRGTRRGTP
jgi:hypothetical protein